MASPAHILVLVAAPYPFGVRVRAQADALVQAGHEVTVVAPTGFGSDALRETVDGVAVRRYPVVEGGRGAAGYVREYLLTLIRMAAVVRGVARDRPVDLVFVCNPPDFLVVLALPLVRRGARILFDYREISPELFEAKFGRRGALFRLLLAVERFALRRADVVTAVSEPCVEIVRTRGGVDPERVFLVGNGPDARRIYPVEPREELRRGRESLVLWLGAMSQQEGLERLIEAADHLVNGLGRRDVAFALVGPGDVHDRLREEIRRRGLDDVVDLAGTVDDDLVRAYMATADVCVGVDERNSMNDKAAMRKILEYMAMGRAVVQFPLAEMRRLCGDATLYAANADSMDLARRIAQLIDDVALREALGRRARERACDGLMWQDQVPRLLAAVEAALGAGRPTPRGAGSRPRVSRGTARTRAS